MIAGTPLPVARISGAAFTPVPDGEPTVGVKALEELARRLREMERPLTG